MTPRAATFLMFVVNGAVVGTWFASIPGIQSSLGASGTEIGLIILVLAVGALVSQQVTGQLLVRFSSRRVLLGTSFVMPVLTVLPLLAPTALSLAIVMFGFGALNTAMDVAMNQHGVALSDQAESRSSQGCTRAGRSVGSSEPSVSASH